MNRAEGDLAGQRTRRLASWLHSGCPLPEDHGHFHELIDAACAEALAGLVLGAFRVDHSPPWAVNRLRAAASHVAAENLQMMAELARIARALECAQIPLMVLKGAALNLTVYSRPDLRPMSDLDLLVKPADALPAVRVLESIGYKKGDALMRADFFPAQHYEQELILQGPQSVRVDLHAQPWRPMHLAQVVPPDALWAESVSISLGDAHVFIPSPETMMVHLSAHAAFHGCSRLIWLYDLKRVADEYALALDWNRVVECAGAWRLGPAARMGLDSAEEFFGDIRPQHVRQAFDAIPATWRDRLTLWHTPRDASAPLLHVACNLACLRGLRARIAYAAAMLLPGPGHLGQSYPFRHFGWVVFAHVQRVIRGVIRVALAPFLAVRSAMHFVAAKGTA